MEYTPQLLKYLESYLSPERNKVMDEVLDQRTDYLRVVTQDVYQLHNTSAVLRSCDVFGIQNLHVIEEMKPKEIQREIALGAQNWVNVHRHRSTAECLQHLRSKHFKIVATSPDKGIPMGAFEIKAPMSLWLGTEKEGLSEEVLSEADQVVHIPMYGFTSSLNISVSAAILLQFLTSQLRQSSLSWKLSSRARAEQKLDWLSKDLKNSQEIIQRFQAT